MFVRVLVLVVDRDDDIGVKAGIETPVVGEENVIEAGKKLLLADPEDSDGNTIFAAVKEYRKLKEKGVDAEVAIVSGSPSLGSEADTKIARQLEELLKDYDEVLLVTDGTEDDQVIPLIISRKPLYAKVEVTVKQAKELEKTYYVIKNALNDPEIARVFLGIPGVIILFVSLFGTSALHILGVIVGSYLLIKGLGIERPLIELLKSLLSPNISSPFLPLHLASIALLVLALFYAYQTAMYYPETERAIYEAVRVFLYMGTGASIIYLLNKVGESFYFQESHKVPLYTRLIGYVIILWLMGDTFVLVASGQEEPYSLVLAFVVSAFVYVVTAFVSGELERMVKTSPHIKGMEVYARDGRFLGKVKEVGKKYIRYNGKRVPLDRVHLEDGRLVV